MDRGGGLEVPVYPIGLSWWIACTICSNIQRNNLEGLKTAINKSNDKPGVVSGLFAMKILFIKQHSVFIEFCVSLEP